MSMTASQDWLSRLLGLLTVAGRLEIRCTYGAPWRIEHGTSAAREMPYHLVLKGTAILEDPGGGPAQTLGEGDLVLLAHGSAHVLHDGSGLAPAAASLRQGANLAVSENAGMGERLDMLCGRFIIAPPHDRLVRDYLPARLIVRSRATGTAAAHLAGLVALMRAEAAGDYLGGHAMLDALSSALFTLALRAAGEAGQASPGLLAMAGNPRLTPALTAMFNDPARPWTLPELAARCGMSRATFMRHFQDSLGRSAYDLLTDLRVSLAANALTQPSASTERVAESAGYQSVAAFRRAFAQRMGMTPGQWRRKGNAATQAPGPDREPSTK